MAQMNSRIERAKSGKNILSKNDERYTPKTVVNYFGKFDYDPATTPQKAKEFGVANYDTKETDGLKTDWTPYKRIWINPPFTLKPQFLAKAVDTYRKTGADIYFLCPIEYLTTAQFRNTIDGCKIFIPTGRLSFENGVPGGKNGSSPAFGSVIIKLDNRFSVEFVSITKLKKAGVKND